MSTNNKMSTTNNKMSNTTANLDLEQPQIHVRIQQIYGRKKVTTITGIEEYKVWVESSNNNDKEEGDKEEGDKDDGDDKDDKDENNNKNDIRDSRKALKNYTNLETLLSQLKKKFNCGGHIVKNENVITLQGEHSYNIKDVLKKYIGSEAKIVVHGKK